jgi:hypothetical protein
MERWLARDLTPRPAKRVAERREQEADEECDDGDDDEEFDEGERAAGEHARLQRHP